jgi:hypothetical protein
VYRVSACRNRGNGATVGSAAIAKPLISESNAQMPKRWCHKHKHKTWTSGKRKTRDMVSRRPSRCSLHQDEFMFGEHPVRNTCFQQ